jgi:biopolymer transport protein ExbD
MADMNNAAPHTAAKGKPRTKKNTTRVDLTAMVDLGFLLITFFMLATTFSKPKTMEVNMPNKTDIPQTMNLPMSKTLTILLGEGDKVYTYVDPFEGKVDTTDFSRLGIRAKLLDRQQEVADRYGDKSALVVLIKSMPHARYKNLVDILDEMAITNTQRYAIVSTDVKDAAIMASVGALR